MACQGHGPSTKQGYLWLIENITGATCMRSWLLSLWGLQLSWSKMFISICIADIKSHIFFKFAWVIGKPSCQLPCHIGPSCSVSYPIRILIQGLQCPSSLSLSLYILLAFKTLLPPWSLHSRMHMTLLFVAQADALPNILLHCFMIAFCTVTLAAFFAVRH